MGRAEDRNQSVEDVRDLSKEFKLETITHARKLMANNYTRFSEMIDDMTPEEAEWIETVLGIDIDDAKDHDQAVANLADLLGHKTEELKDVDLDWWPGFEWSTTVGEKDSLWLYCEEDFQEDCLILFIQSFIRKFRPDYVFTLSAACFCDKPRIKEFGGFCLVITKDEALGENTWDWADNKVNELNAGGGE